jgi:hypothetical protein
MRSPVRRPSSLTLSQPGSRLDKSRSTSRSRLAICVYAVARRPHCGGCFQDTEQGVRHKLYNVMKDVVQRQTVSSRQTSYRQRAVLPIGLLLIMSSGFSARKLGSTAQQPGNTHKSTMVAVHLSMRLR